MTLIKRALGRPDLITAEIERINNMGKGFDNILDMPVGSDEKDIIMENDLPDYDIMNEEIDVDDYMTTIVRDIDKTGKILIAVNIEINRLSIPYFKVYDSNDILTARRVISFHFKDREMEYHKARYEKWILNADEKKHIIRVLHNESERYKGFTNWQDMCFQWNYENNLIGQEFKKYIDGDYDEKYKNHPNGALRKAYVPSTQEMPETWGDDDLLDEEIDFEEEYTDRGLGLWDDFAPDYVNKDNYEDFFVEMTEIYPYYNLDNNIEKNRFKVSVIQDGDGSVPHVHVFFDNKNQKNHGKDRTIAYICLGTNEYAPQHDKETKVLNSQERKALVQFFHTKVPSRYNKDKNGEFYQWTCWQACVDIWMQSYNVKDSSKYFKIDEETGSYVMPDYSEINFPKSNHSMTESVSDTWEESNDLLDESMDSDEDDNSILLLEMAGKLKETAKPKKPKNEELIVAVGSNEETIAHFHVFRNQKDWKQWQNGACIMFEKNAYFDHAKNRAILKKEELEAVISLLKSDFDIPNWNITNWEYLVDLWNQNNDRYEIPYDLEMPPYSFDTIQTYQETKDNKKVYDESGAILDEEVDNTLSLFGEKWREFAPDNVNPDEFFTEMAEIYPKYNEDHNIKKVKFRVCIFENNEGPIPHVHVFFANKGDKNHGKDRTVAYICLGTNEYAPQHDEETKILNSKERKALIAFFNTYREGAYIQDKNGNPVPANCWQECVDRWIQNNYDSEKYFDVDKETGLYVMPDYSEINLSGTNNFETESFDGMDM